MVLNTKENMSKEKNMVKDSISEKMVLITLVSGEKMLFLVLVSIIGLLPENHM